MPQIIPTLKYTRNWEDPADYPTHETSEVQNRKDIQSLFAEIQTYINSILIPVLESGSFGGGGGSGGSGDGTWLSRYGGTMLGPLYLYRDPTTADEAATKQYVDTRDTLERIWNTGEHDTLRGLIDALADQIRETAESMASLSTEQILQIVYYTVAGRRNWQTLLQEFSDLTISGPQTDGTSVWVNVTLHRGDDAVTRPLLMNGTVDMSGDVSADALYANYGEIADLCVDRLSTARKIPRYLRHDTTPIHHIRVQGQVIEFVAAEYAGGTAQAQSPSGAALYWPEEISGLDLGEDGYPVRGGGVRVHPVTTPSEWPVRVYTYTDVVKRSIRFDLAESGSGVYEPRDTFGAGNVGGGNIGYIDKTTERFWIHYLTPDSLKNIGIRMEAGGYVEIDGLRATVALDFSGWEGGRFTEQIEGRAAVAYQVEFDESGRPISIASADGTRTLAVTW